MMAIRNQIQACTRIAIDDRDRCASLVAFIKTETRWQLLARPASDAGFSIDDYRLQRRHFVRAFAAARQQRITPETASFYDAVTLHAASFALLIEARQRFHALTTLFVSRTP